MAADPRIPTPPNVSAASDGVVCPFCAHVRGVREAESACPKCTMEDTLATRRSTGERIGPWFVLQRKNPTAPGLRFSVLLTLARRGHVTAKSIVRGPTTGQLWRFASEVKGLSRMFGICYHCKASVSPDAMTCPRCKSAQEIPDDPDVFLESHSSLPLMRELPGDGFASGTPIANGDDRPSLPPRREPRRPSRDPVGTDELAELTRALAITQPAVDLPRPPRRVPEPRMGVGGEPILSASDLATAFQLDAPRRGFLVRTRRALWTLTKVVVVLAILLGAAGIVISLLKPAWKETALARAKPYTDRAASWWSEGYTLVVGSPPEKSPPTAEPTVTPTDVATTPKPEATVTKKTAPSPPAEDNGIVPPTTPIKLDDGALSVEPKPTPPDRSPSVVDAKPPQSKADPKPPVIETPKAEPAADPMPTEVTKAERPEPAKEEPKPEVAKADPQKSDPKNDPKEEPKMESSPTRELTIDEAIAQANELRSSALDAEARKDWRAAVVIYEQIAKLPEEARPSDLKVKLALARERLK